MKARKPQAEVQGYCFVVGVGSGSLGCFSMLKVFRSCLIQFHGPGCLIARAGQPLLLAPCCSLFRSPRTTAMTTSPTSAPSRPLSRSEYVSTLPPWRRLLAMVNWRPVYDIEQRTKQHELNLIASEKRMQESEKRLKLLKKENERLAALESRMDALLLNADSSSQTPPATGSN